jgi:CheY-like chemotaxis protein
VNSLAGQLEAMGHMVDAAYDGAAALRKAKILRPEMVLLCLDMPGMSGYEVARRLLEQQRDAPPSLVALTSWGRDDDKQRAQDAGFCRYLIKPVTRETLEGLLEDFSSHEMKGA